MAQVMQMLATATSYDSALGTRKGRGREIHGHILQPTRSIVVFLPLLFLSGCFQFAASVKFVGSPGWMPAA